MDTFDLDPGRPVKRVGGWLKALYGHASYLQRGMSIPLSLAWRVVRVPSQHGTGELLVSIEQAIADLAHLDAESQRFRDQRAEIDNRQAEIEEQARRLRTYVDVARKYAEVRSRQATDVPTSTTAAASDTADGRSKSRRITDLAVDLIAAKGRPIRTRDLLPWMEKHGLPMGGRSSVATLSGFLCRDKKRLVNNRKLGWRLVEWGGDTPPNDPPRRQMRTRDRQQTKKAAQGQQDGTAT